MDDAPIKKGNKRKQRDKDEEIKKTNSRGSGQVEKKLRDYLHSKSVIPNQCFKTTKHDIIIIIIIGRITFSMGKI